jgi:LPXTG-site transpeptidase (sortase) family protein
MAYRRKQSNPLTAILQTIILGIVFGMVFFSLDNGQSTRVAAIEHTQPPSTQPRIIRMVDTRTPAPRMAATATPPPQPAATTVFIPTVGIHTSIIEAYLDGTSWDVANLGTNAGHLQGTASLDEPGNVVLAGHAELADGRRGIFARVDEVAIGDPIIVQQGESEWHYIVRSVEITTPDDLSVLYPTQADQLTLITCDAYDFFQDVYLERTVVIAERIA